MDMTVAVADGQVWAQDTGGDGTPLVLMHPGWGDSTIWDPLLGCLAARYRVIRYDARGYGRSPAPTVPYRRLDDLIAVLDQVGARQAALVGHSGGGGPAIGFALARPERVSALVLVAPGVDDYPWPEDDPYGKEFEALFTAGDREGLVRLGLRTWAAAGTDPAAEAQIRSAVAAFFRQGGHVRPDPPAYPRLGEVRAPSVLAIGDLDYPMVRECGERIAGRIPGCRMLVVPGADHLLPLRTPETLASVIIEHVR